MDSSITIASINCQGLGDAKKRRDVFDHLRKCKYALYFLQDTHFVSNLEPYISAEWGYECHFSSYTSNSRGVAILFNNTFEFKVLNTFPGENGNYLIAHIQVKGKDIVLVNTYGPNNDNPGFYDDLCHKIRRLNCENVIIGGRHKFSIRPFKGL